MTTTQTRDPITVIVNGAAGDGLCAEQATLRLERLRDNHALNIIQTTAPKHASHIAAEHYARGQRRFIAVGGDGTAFEVINGLFPQSLIQGIVELGLLPLGTGNSFLRDFDLNEPDRALDAILRWNTTPVDVVRAEHSEGVLHYINLLGLGFTASVGDLTNRRFKRLGAAGYIAAVIGKVASLEAPTDPIRIDDAPVDGRPAVLLSFCNSKFTGGAMKMAPNADPSDGVLDVVRVGALGRRQLLQTFPKIYGGTHIHHPQVEVSQARKVEFTDRHPQAVMVDGEILHLTLHTLEVLPAVLHLVV